MTRIALGPARVELSASRDSYLGEVLTIGSTDRDELWHAMSRLIVELERNLQSLRELR